jgi:hypothetical protein
LQNPAYLGANQYSTDTISLKQIIETLNSDRKADVILGLSVIINDNRSMIHIVIHTPKTEYDHQVNYSGHPQNAPILGVNLVLDRLRRMAANTTISK